MSRLRISTILVLALLARHTAAQSVFPESEPNSAKADADIVSGILPGDTITGTSTGATTGLALATPDSADYFDIRVPPLPGGIYCYSLSLTASPLVDLSLRGESQTGGVKNVGTDVSTQSDPAGGGPNPEDVWYGFGKGERLFAKVTGSSSTTASYTLAYSCTPLTPNATTSFKEGPLTITTIGQGHGTNTEIQLYDSTFTPVAGGHNDDYAPSSPTTQSRVDVTLTAGIYYVAVGDFNTSTDQVDASATEGNLNGNLLDFPDLIVNGSTAGSSGSPLDLSFTITDGVTTFPVTASKTARYQIYFATFTVETPTTVLCTGNGIGTACPCGNFGVGPNGCASSNFSNGAHLANTGLASIAADSLVLVATDVTGPALFFQGSATVLGGAGIPFGDGLLCAGGSLTRLGVVFPSGGQAALGGPISVAGGISVPGTTGYYQAWYRDAAPFCTASTFNLTNATLIVWVQ